MTAHVVTSTRYAWQAEAQFSCAAVALVRPAGMHTTLLPPNATTQEIAVELATARLAYPPVQVRNMWNADTCPEHVLPWLAWALSVDVWKSDWTVAQKRAVIRDSAYIHQHKGTVGAVKRAVQALLPVADIIEFGDADPYTFSVEVILTEEETSLALMDTLEEIALATKNVRSHLRKIKPVLKTNGHATIACAILTGENTTIYPDIVEEITNNGTAFIAATAVGIDLVQVLPEAS